MATERVGEIHLKDSNEIAFDILQENRCFEGEKIIAIINGRVAYKGPNLEDAYRNCAYFKRKNRLSSITPEYIRFRTEDEISQDSLLPVWASFE
ncbi:MAG TPA: hypothetical protein VF185_02380 [Patescibacteria group bacterium]